MDGSDGTRLPQSRQQQPNAKRNNENVDRILRRARKVRQPKACYPCRRRKVKCSGIPCQHCALRGYPELCSMNPDDIAIEDLSDKASHSNSPSSNTSPLQSAASHRKPNERSSNGSNGQLRSIDEHSYIPTQYAPPPVPQRSQIESENGSYKTSLPLSARSPRDGWVQKIYDNIGLQDQTLSYPFENFWTPQKTIEELCLALPSNAHIQRYHQIYREIMLPVYPGLVDPPEFEGELTLFLENRDRVIVDVEASEFDESWLSLLFSVLACGAQCLGSTDKEAELNSKVFVSISFQILRRVNFMVKPNINIVQSLLLMGSCVRNDLNPGITWTMLGMTIRLAQLLGCHERQPILDHNGQQNSLGALKSKLWWAIVWQDSFLAFCYDRPSGTISVRVAVPLPLGEGGQYTYVDCVNRICDTFQDYCRQKTFFLDEEALSYEFILSLTQQVALIEQGALPHIRSAESCINLQQYLEHLAVKIYINHVISQLFWSVLRSPLPITSDLEVELTSKIFDRCVAVLDNILKLRQVSVLTSHYWSILHAAVKSTEFLASNLREDDVATEALVKRLIRSLECSCDDSVGTKSSFGIVLSRTVKELAALLDHKHT